MAKNLKLPYWLAGIALALMGSLFVSDPYVASVVNLVSIGALMAVSLRFVMLIGELNFATAAFVGIGAYTTGSVITIMDWPFGVAMIAGGIVAAVISVAFGYITLRTKGPYFLLIGFAFTEAVRIIYSKSMGLGGNSGMIGIFPPIAFDPWMPTFVMAVSAILIFVLYVVEKSDFGKIFTAIRDNEDVARTVGLNILFVKVACFAIASFAAGVAGSLHAVVNNVISPRDFGFILAAFALAYVKVGGEDNVMGPIVGAVLLIALGSYALGLGGHEHIFYGAAIVLAVLLMPSGITGLLRKVRDRLMAGGD